MIWVTRLDGERILLNDEQVLYVEASHDTMLVLSNGERLRVLEAPEELVDRVAQWRRRSLGLSVLHDHDIEPG